MCLRRIAIVGAGFGGLALALVLKEKSSDKGVEVVVLESQSETNRGVVVGDLNLPSGEVTMGQLGLSAVWDELTAQSDSPNHVPQEALQQRLRDAVSTSSIRYGHRVVGLEQLPDGRISLCCVLQGGSGKTGVGPFDVVVGADGVLSQFRSNPVGSGRIALVGDARWCKDRWYDFGTRRIRCGADVALRDGVELGRILLARTGHGDTSFGDLGHFCAMNKRKKAQMRNSMSLLMVAMAVFINHLFFTGSSLAAK